MSLMVSGNKLPPGKSPTGKFPPIKLPPGEFRTPLPPSTENPRQKISSCNIPTQFLNIPTRVF